MPPLERSFGHSDALGMKRVLLHPYAGVLSAYGMGLAEIRALREKSVEAVLDDAGLAEADRLLGELSGQAAAELAEQGVGYAQSTRRVHLKYQGSDTALLVPAGDRETVVAAFEAAHRQQFGFVMPGKPHVIEAVSVELEGGGAAAGDRPVEAPARSQPLQPLATVDAGFDGAGISSVENSRLTQCCPETPSTARRSCARPMRPRWWSRDGARRSRR